MRRSGLPGRRSFLLVAAATAALWAAVPAAAYDAAPNRGFELLCGAFPCYWLGDSGGTTYATSDTTAHTGARSLFVITNGATFAHAESACITGVASGSYNSSVWYKQAEGLTQIRLIASFYPSTDCSGTATQHQTAVNSPTNDALWHQLSGFAWEAPPATQSARLALEFDCPVNCNAGYSARFDDISLTLVNRAPNGGFEDACPGSVPCSWTPMFSNLFRDTATFHSGAASALLSTSSGNVDAKASSPCMTSIALGVYDLSAWYRTVWPSVILLQVKAFGTSEPACQGATDVVDAQTGSVAADGSWHSVAQDGVSLNPYSARSGFMYFYMGCQAVCMGEAVNFDDFSLVATDRLYNRGFEEALPGCADPCFWSAGPATNVFWDQSVSHSGGHSILVTPQNGNNGSEQAQADCVSTVSSGSHDGSAWYRTTTAVTGVSVVLSYYPGSLCTGTPTNVQADASPLQTDGAWHQIQATNLEAPPGTESAQVILRYTCSGTCTSQNVYFDDTSLDGAVNGPPTSVLLTGFRVERRARGVALDWSSGGEDRTIGYAIERGYHGLFRTITKRLVMAAGAARAASYRLVDYGARSNRTYVYRLFAVDLGGRRTFLRAITAPRR